MNIPELLDAIRRDLTDIDDLARWAHTDGYTAKAPNPDATSRVQITPPMLQPDRDHVAGPRHDIGTGDHRSRTAYQNATAQLRRAEIHLDLTIILATSREQPRPARRLGHTTPPLATTIAAITDARCRLRIIENGWQAQPLDRQRQTRRALNAAQADVDRAWWALTGAFQRGRADPDSQAVGDKPCRICRIRPANGKKGGRCSTCAEWKVRNGFERPAKKLDGSVTGQARDAAARRRTRGEGWGLA